MSTKLSRLYVGSIYERTSTFTFPNVVSGLLVIGGASLYGGRGTIGGTLFGVAVMVMIRNGLNLLGISPFWQGSAIGTIIILAVLAERLVSKRVADRRV
jgi:ribose/xylose/arabinose/galactoside ABC-type transport system permease subunit